MTTVNPVSMPEFDMTKATAFIKGVKDRGGLTKDEQATVQTSVNKILAEDSVRKEAEQRLMKMGETVVALENDFAKIKFSVGEIDAANVIFDMATKEPIRFLPNWTKHHDEYSSLLRASQKTATEVKEKMNSFLTIVLPILQDESKSIEKRKKSLDSYIKGLTDFDNDAAEIESRFLRLIQNVENFEQTLKTTVRTQEQVNKERLIKIDQEIVRLQNLLDESSGFFKACWKTVELAAPKVSSAISDAIETVGPVGSIVISAGVAFLAPFIGVYILGAALIGLGWSLFEGYKEREEEHEGHRRNITTLKHEKEDLLIQQQKIKEIVAQLLDLEKVFVRALENLRSLQQIWRLLIQDAQMLRSRMEATEKEDDELLFEGYVDSLKVTYSTLYVGLGKFTLAIPKRSSGA